MPITRTLTLTIAVLYLVAAATIGTALAAGRMMAGGGVIAYVSGRTDDDSSDILLMDIEREYVWNFTDNFDLDISPAWSPDGSHIAFVSDRDGNMDIYVMGLDGRTLKRLTQTTEQEEWLAWSPDGQYIVFHSIDNSDGKSSIYVMDANGNNIRWLAESIWANPTDGPPAWSPDSKEIVFPVLNENGIEVDVIHVDGSNQRGFLGIDTVFPAVTEGIIHSTTWSPDGQQIAFVGYPYGYFDYELYVANVDGSNPRQLTETESGQLDQQPAWSPDGRHIAFSSYRDGDFDIYLIDPDGTNLRVLTQNDVVNDFSPAWMP